MRKITKNILAGVLSAALFFGGAGGSNIALADTAAGQQTGDAAVSGLQADLEEQQLPTDDLETVQVEPLSFADQMEMQEVPVFDGANVEESLSRLDSVIRGGIGSYGRSKLNEKQQALYDGTEVACVSFVLSNTDLTESTKSVGGASVEGLTKEQLTQTFLAFYYDHPVYCWIGACSYSISGNNSTLYIGVKQEYYTDSSRDAVEAQIKTGVAAYKTETDKYSDTWEKVRAVHDKMLNDVEYAYKSDGKTPETAAWAHNVEGVFNTAKRAVVCEGYAKSFSLITNYLGIPSVFIVGTAGGGGHAWNAVSFDNGATYHYMDLTWDDSKDGSIGYIWFAPPKSFFTQKHTAYTTSGKKMKWQYALPNITTSDLSNTYFEKYHAHATAQNVHDKASAQSFLQTAGASVPHDTMMIVADSTAIMLQLLSAYGGENSYYPCSGYGTVNCYQYFDATRYKVQNPATSFTLSETTVSVDRGQTSSMTLSITPPSNSDDRIVLSVDNGRVVSLSKTFLDLSKGETTVTLTFKTAGDAVITAASLVGKHVETCNVTVTSSIMSEHLYLDEKHQTDAGNSAFAYANGGKKTVNNVSTNYKTVTLYTDLVAPKYKDAKGRTYTGKILAGVTLDKKEPVVKNNKLVKDAAADKIASVSYAKVSDTGGKVTVTAKKPGTVYVWLISLTTKDTVQDAGYAPVELKPAPTKVIYQQTQCQQGEKSSAFPAVTSMAVALNTSFNIYLNPTVVSAEDNKLRETVTENTFSLSVAEKWQDCIRIEEINGSLYGYKIIPLKLKEAEKETKFPITAVCGENGTNAKLNITITNRVKKMDFEKLEEGSESTFTKSDGTLKLQFTQGAGVVKRTAKLRETVELYDAGKKRFDGTKIYQLPTADGFTITNAGKVTVAKGITAEQKKVGMAVVKGTQKDTGADYLITANPGISDGTTAYLLVVHNGLAGKGTGYDVIEVTVGDASVKGNEHPIWANAKDVELKKTKLNTHITPAEYQNGKKTVTGKVVWISRQTKLTGQPGFDAAKHQVTIKSDSKIASVAAGGIVTAKAEGTAYIYAIETGSGEYEEFEVQVKDTPLNIRLYQSADADPLQKAAEYKKETAAQGASVDVYVKGTIGSITKTSNTMKVLSGAGYDYTYAVEDKYKDKVSVTQDAQNGEHFTITAAQDAWNNAGLAAGKTFNVKVDFICIKNGKKGTFTLTVKEN